VAAASKLFSEKGFRGTTTRELAAAVGVTEPILYEHFKTKRDLYAAIIEKKAKSGVEIISALSERFAGADDDRGFFIALGERIVQWYTCDPSFIRLLLFSNLEGHDLRDLLNDHTAAFFGMVQSYIDQRIRVGALHPVDSAVAARAFFGMIAHYSLTGLVFQCQPLPKQPNEVVAGMVDLFLNGLCTGKTQ
jgi:AcrR family transcriptional regulator